MSWGWFGRLIQRNQDIEIDYDNLHLVRPNTAYLRSFRESYKEYKAHNVEDFGYYKVHSPYYFNRFLTMCDELERGVNLDKYESVQTTMFWLVDGKHYLGSGSLRHTLTSGLMVFGGNIGYSVRPCVWKKELGTIQLKLLLQEAKKIGLAKARITCFESNVASKRVIEKNGGYFLYSVTNKQGGKDAPTLIYEIDLTFVS